MSTTRAPASFDLAEALDLHRRELTGYCYRMLGSGAEADDAVQETFTKAWRAADSFEGRSSVRSWLYRIATNVCLDMLRGPQRRARPMDLGPSSTADVQLPAQLGEHAWVQPVDDARVLRADDDPAELVAARESVRMAFVAALQHLPPRQRAVLILCEVLRWQAAEVAQLLETSTASVNSALQRARARLAEARVEALDPIATPEHEELLARYVDAFERYDMDALVQLLRDDVVLSMPPYPLWLQGPDQLVAWFTGTGHGCRGSRVVSTRANGTAAFGSYRPAGPGRWEPFALQLIEVRGGFISGHHNFLFPELFEQFGLPPHLES